MIHNFLNMLRIINMAVGLHLSDDFVNLDQYWYTSRDNQ